MVIKTNPTNLSFYKERYLDELLQQPDLSGNITIIEDETVYWYKFKKHIYTNFQEFDNIDDCKKVEDFMKLYPELFQNFEVIDNSNNIKLDNEKYIHLNKFVFEIKNCDLYFTVIGYRKLII